MPPIFNPKQEGITLSPPIPVNRHHWLRSFKSFFGKPGKDVDTKALFRHGSVMLVYPLQEPEKNKSEFNGYFIHFYQPLLCYMISMQYHWGNPKQEGGRLSLIKDKTTGAVRTFDNICRQQFLSESQTSTRKRRFTYPEEETKHSSSSLTLGVWRSAQTG